MSFDVYIEYVWISNSRAVEIIRVAISPLFLLAQVLISGMNYGMVPVRYEKFLDWSMMKFWVHVDGSP